MTNQIPFVVLALDFGSHYLREVYRGVTHYVRIHPRAFRPMLVPNPLSSRLVPPHPDGIITHLAHNAELRLFRSSTSLAVRVFKVSGGRDEPQLPTVRVDDLVVGRMAAE